MKTIYVLIAAFTITLAALIFLTACTYSVTMALTEGKSSDTIDETSTNTPNTSITPTVTIPVKAI